MILTSNYALKKPEGTDVVNIDDFNANSDIIDGKLKEIESNEIFYAVATGTANTYAITVSAIKSLYDGLAICPKINIASTGASTINVNGYGAKSIVDSLGNPITSGGLKANTPYTLRYNGTVFILQGKGGGGNVVASQLLNGITATGDSGAVVGTMANNGSVVITPGTANQTIVTGFHDGTGYVVGDADLVTGNIKAGVNLFGVAGSSSVVDTSDALATASQILIGSTGYVNGSKLIGAMANNGAVTITPGATAKAIPIGYHNGSGTVATDVNLVTGNILGGKTIFGVTGKASVVETSSANATAGQMLSGATGFVNGALVTGNIASKGVATITPSTVNQTISAGQYISGNQTVLGDGNLVAGNIKSGLSIFGIAGSLSIASLGGKNYVSGTYASGGSITLPWNPQCVIARCSDSYGKLGYQASIYMAGVCNVTVQSNSSTYIFNPNLATFNGTTFVFTPNLGTSNCSNFTYYAWG